MKRPGAPDTMLHTVEATRGPAPPAPVPAITRLLVLGHLLERLVRDGSVRDYAQLAGLVGLSKPRVTQLVNLTLLAPDIQDEVLKLAASDCHRLPLLERDLRRVPALADWNHQRAAFRLLRRRARDSFDRTRP